MQPIIRQIHKFLTKSKKTVAVAESCTGGLLSSMLTALSGSSKYFILGTVPYSNRVKTSLLSIPEPLITLRGAVSKEVALGLSRQVRKLARSDFGVSITGIAGPRGATLGKPVGTVFISVASARRAVCRKFKFKGSRMNIQKSAALKALAMLKNELRPRPKSAS
jgi:nicotinamide-nucleotide amidase